MPITLRVRGLSANNPQHIFDELVGPFEDQGAVDQWLTKNRFQLYSPGVWTRAGSCFFRKVGLSVSAKANVVCVSQIDPVDPLKAEVDVSQDY